MIDGEQIWNSKLETSVMIRAANIEEGNADRSLHPTSETRDDPRVPGIVILRPHRPPNHEDTAWLIPGFNEEHTRKTPTTPSTTMSSLAHTAGVSSPNAPLTVMKRIGVFLGILMPLDVDAAPTATSRGGHLENVEILISYSHPNILTSHVCNLKPSGVNVVQVGGVQNDQTSTSET